MNERKKWVPKGVILWLSPLVRWSVSGPYPQAPGKKLALTIACRLILALNFFGLVDLE